MSGSPGVKNKEMCTALGISIAGKMGCLGFQKGDVASESKQDANHGGEVKAVVAGQQFQRSWGEV